MIGCLLLFINNYDKDKLIRYCLLIASFIILFISIFDLIPTSFYHINKIYEFIPSLMILGIYVLLGGILVYLFDSFNKIDNRLYKIGIISLIMLIMHNIPEGIITFISSSKKFNFGLSIAILIAIHNIPEGIMISIPIYYGNGSKRKAIFYTFIAALSESLGAFLSMLFINSINDIIYGALLALTAGVMIYLSLFEYLKESKQYKKKMFNL